MFGVVETIIARVTGSALWAGISSAVQFLRPTKIKLSKAPRNFFEHFGPGVSKEFVVASIGPPHRQLGSLWLYQFADALAQFDFEETGGAKSVALALTISSPKNGFKVPTLDLPLGKLTFTSFVLNTEGRFKYRSSLRTWELLYEVKFPPTWASNYYTFGALSVLAPGILDESVFDTNDIQRRFRSVAKDVKINWIGISNTSEEVWFEWSIALPISA